MDLVAINPVTNEVIHIEIKSTVASSNTAASGPGDMVANWSRWFGQASNGRIAGQTLDPDTRSFFDRVKATLNGGQPTNLYAAINVPRPYQSTVPVITITPYVPQVKRP